MAATILYVDDESDLESLIRSVYRRQLDAGELRCDFARSGAQALALVDARAQAYDLIVLDVSMPQMDGLELLDVLAERGVETPVVVISGNHCMANIRAAMNRGAFDFLPKPLDLEDLELTQRKALHHAQTLRQARAVERAYGRPELAALGLLVAGVAHDLKNPLGFVSTFASLAAEVLGEVDQTIAARCDPALAEELRTELEVVAGSLETIAAHGESALALTSSLLPDADVGALDLNAALSRHIALFESSVRASAPDLRLRIHQRLDPALGAVDLSSRECISVVINLLENALHALRERASAEPSFEPQIWVETRALDDRAELTVGNNGPPVPAPLRLRIFQPFFTTKKSGEGTGLGLHLIEQIATRRGGKVRVEDRPGGGPNFHIELSLAGD